MTLVELHSNEAYKRLLKEFKRLPSIASNTVEYEHPETGEKASVHWVGEDSYRLVFPGKMVAA